MPPELERYQEGASGPGSARAIARGFVAVGLLLCACSREPAPEVAVRVVLITLDTLRYDRFASPTRMPLTHARAQGGLRLSQLFAASPLTQPTHATLFTGLHPWQHGITRNGQVLDEAPATLAELLRDAGFETHAVVASFPVSSRFGFAQGFDVFDEEFTRELFGRERWEGEWQVPGRAFFAVGEAVTERALAALDASRAARQFLWVHYFDPHAPYGLSQGAELDKRGILERVLRQGEPPEQVLDHARALYDADVAYLDRALDRLFQRLEAESERFETHVVVTADHGESFGEGGALAHGSRLSREQLHVPTFVISPHAPKGARADVAGTIDLFPTLLALVGIAPPPSTGGRDLALAPLEPTRAYGMRRTFRPGQKPSELRLDGRHYPLAPLWFYAADPAGRLRTGNARAVDPVAPTRDTRAADLAALFARFEAELASSPGVDALDPETEQALRALGYVD